MNAQTFTTGTRVRRTDDGRTGTVDPTVVSPALRVSYPHLVPVAWDRDDASVTDPRVLEPISAHRPAVTPVADVHAVIAENGGTTYIAPPPQARRGFSQAGLASIVQTDFAVGVRRAHAAEGAANALAAYVRAVELGQDINSHYEAAVAAAHTWTEADRG